jgi:3D (Asp-Asp-Asp) domain-containing protein
MNNLSSDLIVVGQELAMNGTQAQQQAPAEEVQTETQVKEAPAEKVKEETVETKIEAPAEKPAASEQANDNAKAEGKTISVSATAYTAKCEGCSGVTATGVDLNADPNAKVIAVDPNVIPLGSKVYVEGYGYATAADTGGAIKGNKIDLHVPSKDEAYNWGVQSVNVTIVE